MVFVDPKQIIEKALEAAIDNGLIINRGGAVLNWCDWNVVKPMQITPNLAKKPVACNAMGAILLFIGKECFVSPKTGFDPSWIKEICQYLNVDYGWLWRFNNGFDYGNEIIFIRKDEHIADKISVFGNNLAKKYSQKVLIKEAKCQKN